MDSSLVLFFGAALAWRIFTLVVSAKNERRLKAAGATEYGVLNSKLIRVVHAAYYLCAFLEGYWRAAQTGETTLWGIGLYLFSVAILGLVWYHLGDIWTVKLYIAPNHRVSESWLFRVVRHPNYFLNIIPELVGLALVLRAWIVLGIGLPLYGMVLAFRIREEDRLMRKVRAVREKNRPHDEIHS